MLFWIIFLILVLLCFGKYSYGNIQKPKILESVGVILIIALMGIRFDIGFDYPVYYSLVYPTVDELALNRIEPGSKMIILLASYFNYPPLIFILFSILTYAIAFYALKKYTRNFFLAVITYMTFIFFITLGGIRQGLAISIIIYGIHYLNKKKYVKYSLSVIIAALFHISSLISLIFIPLFILINRNNIILIFCTLSAIIVLGLYSIVNYLFPVYLVYLQNSDGYDGGNLIKIVMLILNVVLLCLCYKTNSAKSYKWIGISILGCIFPFILGGQMGNRVAYYFYAFLCYLIPSLFENRFSNIRKILVTCFCLYFLLMIYVDSMNELKSSYTPYQTILTCDINNPKWKFSPE